MLKLNVDQVHGLGMWLSPSFDTQQVHSLINSMDAVSYWATSSPATFTVNSLSDATTLGKDIMWATTGAQVRALVGAGTSSLEIGTTSSTAKAGNYQPSAADISDASIVGQGLMRAATQAAARAAIGAGTSDLAIGTTATTAKAGNYQPTANDVSDATTVGRNVMRASDAAAARAAIGAGTSDLVIGTTSTTAMAGNAKPATSGNADTATALATARTIALSGPVTGSASFNGTANATIATTLSAPTSSVRGGVTQMPAMTDVLVAPTALNWNQLLGAMRTAGLLAT